MKRLSVYRVTALMLVLAVFLCACGGEPSATISKEFPDVVTPMMQASRDGFSYEIPIESVDHGEDYVIEWQDAGMELAIRTLLGKPEGDILHSDVWDIRLLSIGYSTAKHTASVGASVDSQAPLHYIRYKGEFLPTGKFPLEDDTPVVKDLRDLIHFDNLQSLSLSDAADPALHLYEQRVLDLSGLEQCRNLDVLKLQLLDLTGLEAISACAGLRVLQVSSIPFESLEFLSHASGLEYLYLTDCGTLDLSPLAGLEKLSVLSLYGSDLVSLEPVTQLPALKALNIGSDATYPSLEPLTRSTIEYLDMGCSIHVREEYSDVYDHLDYGSLAKIPNLYFLDLTNHTRVDGDLCAAIVDGCPNLKFLDVSYTPAAREYPKPDGLEAFMNAI